jgi:hypothetical protein
MSGHDASLHRGQQAARQAIAPQVSWRFLLHCGFAFFTCIREEKGMRHILTGIVAIAAAAGLWLIAWPAFGPYITQYFNFPLSGNNEITGLTVVTSGDGSWTARVSYFYTGRPDAVDVGITLQSGSVQAPGQAPQQAQFPHPATKGANVTSLQIQRPWGEEAKTTTLVTATLIDRLTKQEISRRTIAAKIDWPDSVQWNLARLLATTAPEELLKQATALVDKGDTRSLVQAKRILNGLISRRSDFPAANDELVRLTVKANWGPKGYLRLTSFEAITREVNQLMNEHAYQELDELAEHLREGKPTTESGRQVLALFHQTVHGDFYSPPTAINPQTLKMLEDTDELPPYIKSWLAANDCSATARIWSADTYVQAAWQARGTGLANTVNEDQWKRFRALLEKSRKVLLDCKTYGANDPQWYAAMLETLRLLSADRLELAQVFVEGFQKFPDYRPIQTEMAWSMVPKWGGSAEQLEAFARGVAAKFPGREADAAYANLYNDLLREGWPTLEPGIASLKISCARWLRGQEAILAKFPGNQNDNQAAWIAKTCADKSALRKYLARINGKVDPTVWSSNDYAEAAAWAQ